MHTRGGASQTDVDRMDDIATLMNAACEGAKETNIVHTPCRRVASHNMALRNTAANYTVEARTWFTMLCYTGTCVCRRTEYDSLAAH